LAAGEDSLADTVLSRQLATVNTDSARARLFTAALADYLTASPARVGAAQGLLDRAQRLGISSAGRERLWVQLHRALLDFWEQTRPDAPERAQEADSILEFVRGGHAGHLSDQERQQVVRQCYQALMSVAYLTHPAAPDSVLIQLAQHAQDDLVRVGGSNWRDATLPHIVRRFAPEGAVVLSEAARRPAPVVAQVLLPADADTTLEPGIIAVRYQPIPRCLVDYEALLYNSVCTTLMTQLQHWQETYAPRLRITFATPSFGHAVYSGPLSPQEEAQRIAWYVRDYWHIPATVALLAPLSPKDWELGAGTTSKLEITDGAGRVIYRGKLTEHGMRQADPRPFLSALLAHADGAVHSNPVQPPAVSP
jgi:hypothetical protein